jgi:hypothetical protein
MSHARRGGMAIYIVVMVCVIIGVLVSIVFFHGRDSRRKSAEKRDQSQARYLARGAQNHFLLKFRLLPAELYDALSYAVGRNPYFDFGRPAASAGGNTFTLEPGAVSDVGPMFFTGPIGDAGMVTVSQGRFRVQRPSGDALYANGSAGFPASPANRPRMEFLLNQYLLDIATGYPSFDDNGVVTVLSRPHVDAAQMGRGDAGVVRPRSPSRWADPFSGGYIVRSARILASGTAGTATAGRRFESDSLLLTTEAYVLRDKQVSPLIRIDGQLKPLVVQREIATGIQSDSGQLELSEKRETDAQYKARVIDSRSARRTDIMTAVYLVTRRGQ